MAITEDKQRSTAAQDNHVQNAGKQSSESNWQDEAPIGAQAVRRKREAQ